MTTQSIKLGLFTDIKRWLFRYRQYHWKGYTFTINSGAWGLGLIAEPRAMSFDDARSISLRWRLYVGPFYLTKQFVIYKKGQ